MNKSKKTFIYLLLGLASCMPVINNPYDPTTDEFWLVQALRCNALGECTEVCETPAWQGTASFVSTGIAEFRDIAADASCNSYAVGYIQGTSTYTFGNHSVVGKNTGTNAVIVKYAANGEVLWARTVQSATGATIFQGVALDSTGHAYAVGNLTGASSFDFGSGSVTGAGTTGNAMIAKFDSNGNSIWGRSITAVDNTATANSNFAGIAINEQDQIFVAGSIDSTTITSPPARTYTFSSGVTATTPYTPGTIANNAVLVKYDTNGTALLAETASSASNASKFNGIAARGGYVYAVGTLTGNTNFIFDSVTVSWAGASSMANAAILKYDTNFVAQSGRWAASSTSTNSSEFLDVAVDASGNAYAVGTLNNFGTYNFGSASATNNYAGQTGVLVRFNNTGGTIGTRVPASQPDTSIFQTVDVDPFGNLYIGGALTNGPFAFDNISLTGASSVNTNAFYIKISNTGVPLEGKTTTVAPNSSGLNGIAVDASGRLHTAGFLAGLNPFDFGLGPISGSSTSGQTPLILRY